MNITSDITLGFNNKIKDFKKELKSILVEDFFFIVLLDNFNQH